MNNESTFADAAKLEETPRIPPQALTCDDACTMPPSNSLRSLIDSKTQVSHVAKGCMPPRIEISSSAIDTSHAPFEFSPSISVVIPTFNRGFCITRAIDSVIQQTYRPHEIIVVDDGSSDNTQEVIQAYSGSVNYIFQPNAGVSAARNTGVRAARGDWIAFLDSDDEWLPEKLRTQCFDLSSYPQAIAHMMDCSFGEEDGYSSTAFALRGLVHDFMKTPCRERPLRDVLQSTFFPSSWLITRSSIETAGYFNTSMRMCEDIDLLSKIALQGALITNCHVGTRLRRYSESGGLSDLYWNSRLEHFENILTTYKHLSKSPQLFRSEAKYIRKEFSATHVEIATIHFLNRNFREFRRSLMSSLAVNMSFISFLKAVALIGIGPRGYEALRRLRHSRRNIYRRRSAAD